MTKFFATLGDLHSCPIHRGGPILDPGQAHVRLNGVPIAVEGGACLCGSSRSDGLAIGSPTIRIDGKGVMRMGDTTAHGGKITTGKSSIREG